MLILGILYKDDKIVNHRSLLKVLINPIIRYFGYQFGTVLLSDGTLGEVKLVKCEPTNSIKYDFKDYHQYDTIIKKRIIY